MSKVSIEESTLSAIGDAIRNKTGESELLSPLNMPTAIGSISGGGDDRLPALLEGTISGEVTVKNITSIRDGGFHGCEKITKVNLPDVTTIKSNTFNLNSALLEVNAPNLTKMDGYNFFNCKKIIKLPVENLEEIIATNNFGYCNNISTLEFPKLFKSSGTLTNSTKIRNLGLPAVINSGTSSSNWNYRTLYGDTFIECLGIRDCTSLPSTSTSYSLPYNTTMTNWTKFIVDNETPPTLASITGTFYSQANANRLTVYVPKNAVAAYEAATNWSSMNIAAIEDNEEQLIGIFNWIDEKYFSSEIPLLERWNKFLSSSNFALLGWARLKEISDDLKTNGEQSEFYPGTANIVGKSFFWHNMIYTFIDTFVDLDENGNVIPFTISITMNKWFSGLQLSIDDGAPMVYGYYNTKGGWEFTDMRKSFNGDNTIINTWSILQTTDEMINSITPHQKKYIYCSDSGTAGGDTGERICIDIMSLFSTKQIYGGVSSSYKKELQTDTQYKLFKDRGITQSNYKDLASNKNSWFSDIQSLSPTLLFLLANDDGSAYYTYTSTTNGRFMYITV